jgi:hypothetical protein
MKKQVLCALTAALLGLISVIVLSLVFQSAVNNLWVLIGISVFVSCFSAFLSLWGSPFFSRFKQGWDFGNPRDVHQKLAALIPENKKLNEIIFVAYTANSAYRLMEIFEKRNCNVERLRILLRSPVALASSEGKAGSIPNAKVQIDHRLSQMRTHLLGDILKKHLGMQRVHRLEVKFFEGEPVLRGMVIDGKKGFFSIYTKRQTPGIIDYSANNSAALRISDDRGYEGKILSDFLDWFNLVWEYGSKTITDDVLDKIL